MVEVKPLKKDDFVKILKFSQDNVLDQSTKLLKTEGINIIFNEDAIEEISEIAEQNNIAEEDTGARRLVKIVDKVLEEINYNAPEIYNELSEPGKSIM